MQRPVRIAALALIVGLTGCGGAGPSSALPSPPASPAAGVSSTGPSGATSASAPASPLASSPVPATPASATPEAIMSFTLTSSAFDAGGSIPRRFTCDGPDVSPALAWSGVPAGAQALVLLVDDPDARGWVHWIVLDLPGTSNGSLPQGVSPMAPDPAQGTNDFGRRGWGGPCPPSGTHRYTFTLTALAAPLGLAGAPDGTAVRRALERAQVLGTAVLQGTYRRGG